MTFKSTIPNTMYNTRIKAASKDDYAYVARSANNGPKATENHHHMKIRNLSEAPTPSPHAAATYNLMMSSNAKDTAASPSNHHLETSASKDASYVERMSPSALTGAHRSSKRISNPNHIAFVMTHSQNQDLTNINQQQQQNVQ